jgi:hypothetical protein
MTRTRYAGSLCLILAGLAAAGSPVSAQPGDLASLFPRRAELTAPAGELARLDVPAEVLAACRPDLSDLRIVVQGREVPYAVLEGLAPDRAVEIRQTVTPEVRAVDLGVASAGDPDVPPLRTERFVLSPPPPAPGPNAAAPASERWHLVVEPDRSAGRGEVVRRVTVTDLRGEPWQRVAEEPGASRLLASGSIFRLPGGPASRLTESLRVPLPRLDAAPDEPAGDLLVTLEGRDAEPLRPAFRWQRVREIAGEPRTRIELEVLDRRSESGRTVITVARPWGLVPDRLEIETSTPAFDRRVEVWDQGPGAAGPVGWGRVWRAGGAFEDGEGEGSDGRQVALQAPRGERLGIEIVDGDSPPLDDLAVVAAVRRPALVFALPGGSGATESATLYFGGGRALAPRYDVQGLVPSPPTRVQARAAGERAETAERLLDPARLPAATLGPPEANPRYEARPALAFAMRPGAALPSERWAWRRPIMARPSPEGLVRLLLTPEDLARARDDLADLRIVDAPGTEDEEGGDLLRQWAYLLGERPVRELRELRVGSVTRENGTSRYELVPEAAVPVAGLILTFDAPFFDRPFVLRAVRADRERVIAEGRLVLAPRDPRPVEIALPEPSERADRLVLVVEDGDDAPLELAEAGAWVPLPEVYFAAPAGDYELLLGNPRADAPRYELARVRDVVLTVAAGEAETGELEPNPDHSPGLAALLSPRAQTIFLWTVLVLAVAGLLLLTLRLARREG